MCGNASPHSNLSFVYKDPGLGHTANCGIIFGLCRNFCCFFVHSLEYNHLPSLYAKTEVFISITSAMKFTFKVHNLRCPIQNLHTLMPVWKHTDYRAHYFYNRCFRYILNSEMRTPIVSRRHYVMHLRDIILGNSWS